MEKSVENMSNKDKWILGLLAAGAITGIGYLIYSSNTKKTTEEN